MQKEQEYDTHVPKKQIIIIIKTLENQNDLLAKIQRLLQDKTTASETGMLITPVINGILLPCFRTYTCNKNGIIIENMYSQLFLKHSHLN